MIFACLMLPVGAYVIRNDHWLSKPLAWSPIALVGVLSYGIYLLRMLSCNVVKIILSSLGIRYGILAFPLTVGLVIAVAWVSYTCFESCFLRRKQRFSRVS